jgi:hypothetical protein
LTERTPPFYAVAMRTTIVGLIGFALGISCGLVFSVLTQPRRIQDLEEQATAASQRAAAAEAQAHNSMKTELPPNTELRYLGLYPNVTLAALHQAFAELGVTPAWKFLAIEKESTTIMPAPETGFPPIEQIWYAECDGGQISFRAEAWPEHLELLSVSWTAKADRKHVAEAIAQVWRFADVVAHMDEVRAAAATIAEPIPHIDGTWGLLFRSEKTKVQIERFRDGEETTATIRAAW